MFEKYSSHFFVVLERFSLLEPSRAKELEACPAKSGRRITCNLPSLLLRLENSLQIH